MWLLLASLAVFAVAVIASSVFVFLRGRELFRALRGFSSAAEPSLERLSDGTARLGGGRSPASVTPSLARLRASQAQLAVLLAAVGGVRASVGRVTAVVPRK